jgi:hypothetical protein
MRIFKALVKLLFVVAVFITGYGMGMCVKVFMVRGVPVINGGGELLLLLAIPAAVFTGYRMKRNKENANSKKEDHRE